MGTPAAEENSAKPNLFEQFAFRAYSLYLILFFLFVSDYATDYFGIVPWLKYFYQQFNICAIGLTSLVNKLFIHRHFRNEMFLADTYWTFVCFMSFLVLSIIISLVWTWLDKGKKFTALGKYTTFLARYYVAFILAIYASYKLIGMQFAISPWPVILMKPVSELDPHQMFWTFMGASKSYSYFAGALEFAACLLLLFRRTSAAGALLAVPVLVNIIVLDIAYDTWVKFAAIHLLFFSIYILRPDIKSLFQYLVLRCNNSLSLTPAPVINGKKYPWLLRLLKFAFIATVFFVIAKQQLLIPALELHSPYANIVGNHQIMDMTGGGQPKTITRSDSTTWEKIAVNSDGSTTVLTINGKLIYCGLKKGDPVKHSLEFAPWNDSTYRVKLHYDSIGKGDWLFTGTIKNDSVRFTTKRIRMDQTTLLKDNGKIKWFYWGYP